jgi:hypothetical protein
MSTKKENLQLKLLKAKEEYEKLVLLYKQEDDSVEDECDVSASTEEEEKEISINTKLKSTPKKKENQQKTGESKASLRYENQFINSTNNIQQNTQSDINPNIRFDDKVYNGNINNDIRYIPYNNMYNNMNNQYANQLYYNNNQNMRYVYPYNNVYDINNMNPMINNPYYSNMIYHNINDNIQNNINSNQNTNGISTELPRTHTTNISNSERDTREPMQVPITVSTRNELRDDRVYLEPRNLHDVRSDTRPITLNTGNQDNINVNSEVNIVDGSIDEKHVKGKLKKTYGYAGKDNEDYTAWARSVKTYLTLYKVEKYLENDFSNSRNEIQKLNALCVYIYLEECCTGQAKTEISLSENYGNPKKAWDAINKRFNQLSQNKISSLLSKWEQLKYTPKNITATEFVSKLIVIND